MKVKAKTMTKREAIPFLVKILKNGDFGKRKHRAMEIAIETLRRIAYTGKFEQKGKSHRLELQHKAAS